MISVPITLRSVEGESYQAEGYAPSETCPLAVSQVHVHDSRGDWKVVKGRWFLVHRPTGYHVGKTGIAEWDTAQEAYDVLLRCQPGFPAWLVANGGGDDMATLACRTFYRAATGFEP